LFKDSKLGIFPDDFPSIQEFQLIKTYEGATDYLLKFQIPSQCNICNPEYDSTKEP
jgi:hypothetical protein